MTNQRYIVLDQIGIGGMGVVYRAHDKLTNQMVALKQVTASPHATANSSTGTHSDFRQALATEFRTLATLRHPHIISVLDYGFDEDKQPFFTMELLNQSQTILQFGQHLPFSSKTDLLRQVVEALAYLHRHGVIHRDLKPDNILIENGVVKVLDFGLAFEQSDFQEETVGTLAYMAPEMLNGEVLTPQIDQYALGVIAFELFNGSHPFYDANPSTMINYVLSRTITTDMLDVPKQWADIVVRLLSKDPKKRYLDENELLRAVDSRETHTLRESFLQSAQFVGRKPELSQLERALREAMDGRGSAWLVGGESGVGKSRLIEELRIKALIEGVVVLRGQAIIEAGAPFFAFRDILRRLVIHTEISDFEAGVFQTLIPDIETLLERKVPTIPEIDPASARNRLFTAIEEVFKRQKQPILIILEDLQWMRDTINILKRILKQVDQLPLLIVGNYRDDERPTLPAQLPEMQVIKLNRLTTHEIADLMTAMVGETPKQNDLVDLLQHETEGNAFFIVEVVRALAENSETLSEIGYQTIPQTVFTGGLKTVLQRRIDRVPSTALPLLQTAAVAGRELDLKLLAKIAPQINLDAWLNNCGSVLEVHAEKWRFAHDKLRENILNSLSSQEIIAQNRQVAQAMERLYGANPNYTPTIAYHYGKANDNEKEGEYSAKAGTLALKNSTYETATRYFERALAISPKLSSYQRAVIEDQLGRAYLAMSRMTESQHYLQSALKGLQYPIPTNPIGLTFSTIRQIITQVSHRFNPVSKPHVGHIDALRKSAGIYEQLAEVFYFANDTFSTINTAIKSVNLAEQAYNDSDELAIGYASLSVLMSAIPMHSQAAHYGEKAVDVARRLNHAPTLGWVYYLVGVNYISVGEWGKSITYLQNAIDLNKAVGDIRRWEMSLSSTVVNYTYRGKYTLSQQLSNQQYESAKYRGDIQTHLWSLFQALQNALCMDWDILTPLEEAETVIAQSPTLAEKIYGYGLMARARYRLGDIENARKHALTANQISVGVRPLSFYSVAGYGGAAQTFLSLWEQHGESREVMKESRLAVKLMRNHAQIFPMAQGRAFYVEGLLAFLEGKPERAKDLWNKSLAWSQKLQMPYDEAMALVELGRFDDHHLDDATRIITQLKQDNPS